MVHIWCDDEAHDLSIHCHCTGVGQGHTLTAERANRLEHILEESAWLVATFQCAAVYMDGIHGPYRSMLHTRDDCRRFQKLADGLTQEVPE